MSLLPLLTPAERVATPHLAFPFRRVPGGGPAVVEQDAAEHVTSCENVIAACPAGFRLERPDFGWDRPMFAQVGQRVNTGSLADVLRRFEPRSAVTAEDVSSIADRALAELSVQAKYEVGE